MKFLCVFWLCVLSVFYPVLLWSFQCQLNDFRLLFFLDYRWWYLNKNECISAWVFHCWISLNYFADVLQHFWKGGILSPLVNMFNPQSPSALYDKCWNSLFCSQFWYKLMIWVTLMCNLSDGCICVKLREYRTIKLEYIL